MGVPGHDQRDWDFATAFHIPIVEVVEGGDITKEAAHAQGRYEASHGQLRLPQRNKTIKKVTDDIDTLKMNTAIAALMTMVNEFYANGLTRGDFEKLLLMLSPFAPHMVEELWEQLGCAAAEYGKDGHADAPWRSTTRARPSPPTEMAVQVNGKLKGTVTVAMDSEQDAVVEAAVRSRRSPRRSMGCRSSRSFSSRISSST